MSILIICEPGVDGAFRYVEGLCRHLFSGRETVHLAYSSLRGSTALDQLVRNVAQRGGRILDMKVGNQPSLRDIPGFCRLLRLAREVEPAVVHSHSSKAGVLGRALALAGMKAKFYYTPHAYYGMGGRRGPGAFLFNSVETVLGRIGRTINVSDDEGAFAVQTLRVPRSSISVVPLPVNTSAFRPALGGERENLRARFNFPEDALVIGTIGRLCAQKDPQTLYKVMARAMQLHDRLWLCHVGRGELESELKGLAEQLGISGRIIRIPYLDTPADVYRALDAFIITSRYEGGGPTVVLEALASDLPLVMSRCPGTSNINRLDLSHCWGAEPGDIDGFVQSVQSWVADIPCQRPCNHRRIAEQQFSAEALFGRVAALYEGAPSSLESPTHPAGAPSFGTDRVS